MKKLTLSELTDQAIALMQQMREMGKDAPGYLAVYRQWSEVQDQIAKAGNHSMSKSATRAIARQHK